MRSTRRSTTSSALALLAAVACSRGHRDAPDPETDPAEAGDDYLARRACACETLSCMHELEQKIKAEDPVEPAVRIRVGDCADQLGRKLLLGPFRVLTDDLCACADRACYDGLRLRVNALMDPRTTTAGFSPAFISELQAIEVRFDACDAKWSGGK